MLNLSEIPRVTLINIAGRDQECTVELFRQWLDVCGRDPRDEAATVVGALCDAFRQLRNDYEYERGRADSAIAALAHQSPAVGRVTDSARTVAAPEIQP